MLSSGTARAKQRDEMLKQEDHEIQDDLSYILSLRTAWARWDPVSEKHQNAENKTKKPNGNIQESLQKKTSHVEENKRKLEM